MKAYFAAPRPKLTFGDLFAFREVPYISDTSYIKMSCKLTTSPFNSLKSLRCGGTSSQGANVYNGGIGMEERVPNCRLAHAAEPNTWTVSNCDSDTIHGIS